MSLNTNEQIILLTIRDMTVRKLWCCPTEVHRVIGLAGINAAPKGASSEEWNAHYMKTLKTLSKLMREGYIKEVELMQHGIFWDNFRLTRKAHDLVKGFKAPKEIREELKPVFIDFKALDEGLGIEHVERKEFVPIRQRRVKVQTQPHWNSGDGRNPIR